MVNTQAYTEFAMKNAAAYTTSKFAVKIQRSFSRTSRNNRKRMTDYPGGIKQISQNSIWIGETEIRTDKSASWQDLKIGKNRAEDGKTNFDRQ
jgi:hypothetical protein